MQPCPFRDKNQWVELFGKTLQSLRPNYRLQTGQSTIVCNFDQNVRYMKLYRAPFVKVYHTRMARMDRTFPYLASRHSATMLRICLSIWSSTLLTVVLFFSLFCYITKQSHRLCYSFPAAMDVFSMRSGGTTWENGQMLDGGIFSF